MVRRSSADIVGYHVPAYHPPWLLGKGNYLQLVHYAILWTGAYFRSDEVSAIIVGVVVFAIFICVLGTTFALLAKDRNWRSYYPWLALAAYACVTCAVTAVARLAFGVNQALDSRYTTFSLFFFLALTGAIFSIYCVRIKNARTMVRDSFLVNLGAMIALSLTGWLL